MADSYKAIGRRLAALREALEFETQVEFAQKIGVAKSTYSLYENGERRITLDVALRVKKQFGVPIDWIYTGDVSALPIQLIKRISPAPAA